MKNKNKKSVDIRLKNISKNDKAFQVLDNDTSGNLRVHIFL
jgi:hypothetical protein